MSAAPRAEALADALLERGDLRQLGLEVAALLLQQRLVLLEHGEEARQLRALVASRLVHVDQLANLRQRQAEPLAAQRQLQARAVAQGVDAALALAPRREQALVLVEADRARGDVEFAREVPDRVLGALLGLGRGRLCGHVAAKALTMPAARHRSRRILPPPSWRAPPASNSRFPIRPRRAARPRSPRART